MGVQVAGCGAKAVDLPAVNSHPGQLAPMLLWHPTCVGPMPEPKYYSAPRAPSPHAHPPRTAPPPNPMHPALCLPHPTPPSVSPPLPRRYAAHLGVLGPRAGLPRVPAAAGGGHQLQHLPRGPHLWVQRGSGGEGRGGEGRKGLRWEDEGRARGVQGWLLPAR